MGMNVPAYPQWFADADCDVSDFDRLASEVTRLSDYPLAADVVSRVLSYDALALAPIAATDDGRRRIMAEWGRALQDGPGVFLIKGAFPDAGVVDDVTDAFSAIIEAEKTAGLSAGDHFAQAGANDRVWNALEKLAVQAPEAFVRYYANDMVALACEAWLGPNYQVTSQVNQVNPGGKAQSPHRDYHLGFQSAATATRYPARAHLLSASLTLQGAVAHGDMPIESGPTLLLPHSQKYAPGYVAWHLPQFQEYFAKHHVQLPLAKGDAIFFNPALHHAAGENRSTDIRRMANLLQVSSAMGRAMESVDRERIVKVIYPYLVDPDGPALSDREMRNAIAASAEGYAFPTNLDRDPPSGAEGPPTQAEMLRLACSEHWPIARLVEGLDAGSRTRLSH